MSAILRRVRDRLLRRISVAGDEGSALLFALIFIITIALIMGAALTFVNTGNLGTTQFVDQRDRNYYIDGAVQGAINAIRPSPREGLPINSTYNGVACPDYTAPAAPSVSVGNNGTAALAGTITVKCQALTPSGPISGGGSITSPAFAILTLGDLNLSQNNTLAAQGAIGVNGSVNFASGTPVINDEGDVSIVGNCDNHGVVQATGFVAIGGTNGCYSGTLGPTPTAVADPNFSAGDSGGFSLPTSVDPTPTCLGSGAAQVVKFTPGLYSDAPMPPAACKTAPTWWFSPGTSGDGYYYFDFPDTANNRTWQLSGATVIAGAANATTWTPGVSAPPNPTPTSTACDTGSGANGVQFIIGGATQIAESDTSTTQEMEICSPHPSTAQQIAIYALKTGTRSTGTSTPAPTSASTPSGADVGYLPGDTTFPEAAATIPNNKTAAIRWSGFQNAVAPTTPVPAGAAVTSVQVQVVHTVAAGGKVVPTIKLMPAQTQDQSSAPAALTHSFSSCNASASAATTCTNSYDFVGDLDDLLKYQSIDGQSGRPGMSIEFDAKANGLSADAIQSLSVTINYTAPGLEGVHCANQAIGACTPTSLDASSNKNTLIVHGTTYMPTAQFNVYGHNKNNQLFDRGVIVNTLNCDVSASFKQLEALFTLPSATPTGRTVKFTATTAGSASPSLVAIADFYDSEAVGGIQVADPGHKVKITQWSVLK